MCVFLGIIPFSEQMLGTLPFGANTIKENNTIKDKTIKDTC
jgi:hypothetical protein